MDRMLYVAMTGASQTMLAQSAHANNLANVSTSGFRADLNQFRAMQVFGAGHPTRVYAMSERPAVDLAQGTITQTGNDLDVALQGEGWIAVQAPDGSEGYTRNGSLRIGSGGRLETADGYPVLGNAGPIALPPAEKVDIAADGTVSLRPVGQDAVSLAVVDRIKLVRPAAGELEKGADGLMHLKTPGLIAVPDAAVRLAPGALESSNVNAVESMIQMITLARQFEMQIKLMHTARENDRASAELMRIS